MAPNILVTADFSEAGLDALRALGEVTVAGWGVTGLIATEAETARMFAGADIVAIGYEPVTEAVFAATDLKYLASIRGGPGANIDLLAAAKRGIPVTAHGGPRGQAGGRSLLRPDAEPDQAHQPTPTGSCEPGSWPVIPTPTAARPGGAWARGTRGTA